MFTAVKLKTALGSLFFLASHLFFAATYFYVIYVLRESCLTGVASFTDFQMCYMVLFSVWASSPQSGMIMWLMCCSWMLSRNQIHAPLADEYASITTRVFGRTLAHFPLSCTSHWIILCEEREEFCLGISDQKDVKSDSRVQVEVWVSSVWRVLTSFRMEYKKKGQQSLLIARVAYLPPSGRCVWQWVAAFLSLFLDRLGRAEILHG